MNNSTYFIFVAVTFAVASASAMDTETAEAGARNLQSSDDKDIGFYHICDPAIASVIAWCVMVINLEVNDFRHHLHLSGLSTDDPKRHIASYVAIRLGLRDALFDTAIMYSIGYSIVAAFTWGHADPNSLYVIWGISTMVAAWIMSVCSFKVPQWLGIYHKSNLQLIKDTSDRAPKAIHDLVEEGSTITSLRYQTRLGVGKHTAQFLFFLLPFYTDLRIWSFGVSVVVGLLFGLIYLSVVAKCRRKFRSHRHAVAFFATFFLTAISALVFASGMRIVNHVWNWGFAQNYW
jgi:hypothetical protein